MMQPLPNTRSAIRPDTGMVLIEVDLKQADGQAVAWYSDCRVLKGLFKRGLDIYTETETGVWGERRMAAVPRQTRKNVIHSGHYGAKAPTIADRYMGGDTAAANFFLETWFAARPEIRLWQSDVAAQMSRSRTPTIHNVWGFRRVYACAVPITQSLAWLGQSTTSITKDRIMLRIDDEIPEAELLLESHDSVLMQLPMGMCPDIFPRLLKTCEVEIPFPGDPLVIPVELKWSMTDWGHMEEFQG